MSYFPLFLDSNNKKFLIIGGGNIALAKLEALLEFTNNIELVAKEFNAEILALIAKNNLKYLQENYAKKHLQNFDVIIAATNCRDVNEQIVKDARALNKLVNVVDDPKNSDFIFGANIKQKNITISSSSSGLSPVLARLIKQKINLALPKNLEILNDFIEKNRDLVKEKLTNVQARRIFWQEVLESLIADELDVGNFLKAQKFLEEKLNNTKNQKQAAVYFIGAGPGDPELITLKAIKLLSKADVVLYDRLIAKEILDYARRDAIKINVGKSKGNHLYDQNQINALIKEYAQKGNIVARLKGGDPSIFGHLSEEVEVVANLKIPYQIVAGVTAAIGAAATSGIPLTSRDSNKSVRFLTVYNKDLINENYWQEIAKTNDSLVLYMSSSNLGLICEKLMQYGFEKNTPIAVIEQATTKFQKTYISIVANFKNDFAGKEFVSPSLAIIGEVVKQHEKYQWREENLNGYFFEKLLTKENAS